MAAESSFADVAVKTDQEHEAIEAEAKALAALEADLIAAETRFEEAEERFNFACRKVDRELAKPIFEETPTTKGVAQDIKPDELDGALDKEATEKHHKGNKNTSALSEKVVSHERWLAKRSQENRVREATKRGRERLRTRQRDRKFDHGADGEDASAETPAPAPAPTPTPEAPKARELVSADTQIAKDGAKSIAERLVGLKEISDEAQRKSALAKVLTGGRDHYYTFEPKSVVNDLKDRGLLDATVATTIISVVESAAPAGSKRMPPSDWLAHAKKAVAVPDHKPFTESENTYLQAMEDKELLSVEKELEAAEAVLQEVLGKVDAYNLPEEDDAGLGRGPAGSKGAEIVVDEDYAAQVEGQYEASRESRGAKNTSTMTDKQVSCQKWEAARGQEAREREHDKKVRDTRREEARDRKMDSGTVE